MFYAEEVKVKLPPINLSNCHVIHHKSHTNHLQAMTDFIYGVRGTRENVFSPTTDVDVVMKIEFSAPQSTFERRFMMLVTVPAELPWIWVYAYKSNKKKREHNTIIVRFVRSLSSNNFLQLKPTLLYEVVCAPAPAGLVLEVVLLVPFITSRLPARTTDECGP